MDISHTDVLHKRSSARNTSLPHCMLCERSIERSARSVRQHLKIYHLRCVISTKAAHFRTGILAQGRTSTMGLSQSNACNKGTSVRNTCPQKYSCRLCGKSVRHVQTHLKGYHMGRVISTKCILCKAASFKHGSITHHVAARHLIRKITRCSIKMVPLTVPAVCFSLMLE